MHAYGFYLRNKNKPWAFWQVSCDLKLGNAGFKHVKHIQHVLVLFIFYSNWDRHCVVKNTHHYPFFFFSFFWWWKSITILWVIEDNKRKQPRRLSIVICISYVYCYSTFRKCKINVVHSFSRTSQNTSCNVATKVPSN